MAPINFNLISTTFKYAEEDAQEELLELLELFGDDQPESQITDINGVLVAYTNLDAFQIIDSVRQLVKNEPWLVRYVLRLIPIEAVVHTKLEDMAKALVDLTSKMHIKETFRITVERRHTLMDPKDIIVTLASQIENKVDLKNPNWIVLVEVIGALTGISILKPDQIFRSVIEKRNSSNGYNAKM
jgi:tRNA acetyltransferase TAN1